jgi:hypothetical protein
MSMKEKTPQEKKALSYAKDRRNDYGENDKSSRRNIPLRKARQNRGFRKTANQILQKAVGETGFERIEIVENELRSLKKTAWKKAPDAPLGEFVQEKLKWRQEHAGKGKRTLKKIREIIENLEIAIEQETGNRWIATATNLSDITAVGETPERAVEKLKYVVHAAAGNTLGFDMRISVDGKFIKPIL